MKGPTMTTIQCTNCETIYNENNINLIECSQCKTDKYLMETKTMDQKKTYKVYVDETTIYSINIEAKNSEEAYHSAIDIWGSHGPDSFKLEDVSEWNVTDVEEIKEKEVA